MHFNAHLHLETTSSSKYYWRVSRNPREWEELLALSHNYPNQLFSIGVHPWWANEWNESIESQFCRLIEKYPQLQIGEIGIDSKCDIPINIQLKCFYGQMKIAQKFERKVNIHLVGHYDLMEKALRENTCLALIHAYGGSVEWMKQMEALGVKFSFGEEVLHPNRLKAKKAFIACKEPFLESDERVYSQAKELFFVDEMAKLRGLERLEFEVHLKMQFERLFG